MPYRSFTGSWIACLLLFSLLVIASPSAGAQIGLRPPALRPEAQPCIRRIQASTPPALDSISASRVPPTIRVPDPPISDRTIISDIVITYGQTVSGDAQVSAGDRRHAYLLRRHHTVLHHTAYFQETYCPSFGGPFDAGTHILTAVFSGDSVYAGSTSNPVQVTVLPEATMAVLRSSLNPAGQGQPVTFTAVFSGKYTPPTGPVVFYDGETPIATAALDGTGTAFFTTSTLAPGPHAITARFAGALTSSRRNRTRLKNRSFLARRRRSSRASIRLLPARTLPLPRPFQPASHPPIGRPEQSASGMAAEPSQPCR